MDALSKEDTLAHYWIVVGGPEVFETTRAMGFTRQGFKSTRRIMAQRIAPGDKLVFYITGRKQFGAIAEVTSPVVEEQTRIWSNPKKPAEMYPYRAGIKPLITPDQEHWLDAEPYHDRFSWTQKWPRANWTLAYQGNLHEIPEEDFKLIEKDMEKAASAAAH
jgi:predicted RNA-binding protein